MTNNNSETSDPRDHHPSINYYCGLDGQEVSIACGYLHDEPTAVLFKGDSNEPVVTIPLIVLKELIANGWETDYSNLPLPE